MKAKYFKLEEFTRSATAQRLGIENIPSEEAVKNLSHLVWNVLDPLRERWGSAIIVNSGFRCEALNKAVGGARASYHRLGMAADIRPRNGRLAELYESDKEQLKKYAKLLYAEGCLIGGAPIEDPRELTELITELMI